MRISNILPVIVICILLVQATLATCPAANAEADLKFDGQKAYSDVEEQMNMGFRIPGSQGSKLCRDYIISQMETAGLGAQETPFDAKVSNGTIYHWTNVVAWKNSTKEGAGEIILGAHYDTRPFTDQNARFTPQDPDYSLPVPGANDGASGVAVLLELARALKDRQFNYTLVFVFFDGEDWGENLVDMFMGSKAYTAAMTPDEVNRTREMILVDMVGDANLNLSREYNSNQSLWDELRNVSIDIGYGDHWNGQDYDILDDHIQFKRKGISVVDLIDFDYTGCDGNCWHTPNDTIEHVSADSLQVVGRTLEAYLVKTAGNSSSGNDGDNDGKKPKPIPEIPIILIVIAVMNVSWIKEYLQSYLRKR
jgi:glutaminyl-peptide cyclotransferase